MASAFAASLSLPLPISLFPSKPNLIPSPNALHFPKPLFVSAPIAVAKAKNKNDSISAVEVESDEDEDVVDGDEEDEEFVAFEEMRKWEANKPAGFGEGKVYDTTLEEGLLEEMERERMAMLDAEKTKMAMKIGSGSSRKQEQQMQAQKDVIPSGPSVRLGSLPKKKNIHRDLQAAFKGLKGIVKISPAVTGNWKTRDPVCKGFAYVELVSEEAAIRFANTYSKQEILFGKVQKQISCDIIKPGQSVTNSMRAEQKFLNSGDETLQEELNGMLMVKENDKEPVLMNGMHARLSDSKEIETSSEHLITPPSSDKDNENESHVIELRSDSLEVPFQKQSKQIASKKKVVKKKKTKTAKLSSPSSMASNVLFNSGSFREKDQAGELRILGVGIESDPLLGFASTPKWLPKIAGTAHDMNAAR